MKPYELKITSQPPEETPYEIALRMFRHMECCPGCGACYNHCIQPVERLTVDTSIFSEVDIVRSVCQCGSCDLEWEEQAIIPGTKHTKPLKEIFKTFKMKGSKIKKCMMVIKYALCTAIAIPICYFSKVNFSDDHAALIICLLGVSSIIVIGVVGMILALISDFVDHDS